jgi:HNH endonuclease
MPGKSSRRARKRRKNHNNEKVFPHTYDGVTDEAVYTRDKWTCRMPVCKCPDGRAIDPRLQGEDADWAPSIDHVVPLRFGGPDTGDNKRAAHRYCNEADANSRNKAIGPLSIGSRLPPEAAAALQQMQKDEA